MKDMENYFVESLNMPSCELEQNPADYALTCAAATFPDGRTAADVFEERF